MLMKEIIPHLKGMLGRRGNPLVQKKCQPCEGMGDALKRPRAEEFLKRTPGWRMNEESNVLSRIYTTKNFRTAVEFIERIAEIAESENHHPDIHLTDYRKLKIDLTTHAIGGLSENDFIMAAKINTIQAA